MNPDFEIKMAREELAKASFNSSSRSPALKPLLRLSLKGEEYIVGAIELVNLQDRLSDSDWKLKEFEQEIVICKASNPSAPIFNTGIKLGSYVSDSMGGGSAESRSATCSISSATEDQARFTVDVLVKKQYWSNQNMDSDWRPDGELQESAVFDLKVTDKGLALDKISSDLTSP